jgi:hypothetical protein
VFRDICSGRIRLLQPPARDEVSILTCFRLYIKLLLAGYSTVALVISGSSVRVLQETRCVRILLIQLAGFSKLP